MPVWYTRGMPKINAVFEGGGVKGVGLVGAVMAAAERGYELEYLAGTSAGAIVASLLCGYSPKEVTGILALLNFTDFIDLEGTIPVVGQIISEIFHQGILKGDHLEKWLEELLDSRGIKTFHDLLVDEFEPDLRKRYRLHVVATDLTSGEMIIFPDDLPKYGIDIDSFSVAHAVRCSMAIPFIFNPVKLGTHTIVDGALISDCPLWLFPERAFGFRLVDSGDSLPERISNGMAEAKAVLTTLINAVDKYHIHNNEYKCMVPIPTLGISTCDFNITQENKQRLYQSGYEAANIYFDEYEKEPR